MGSSFEKLYLGSPYPLKCILLNVKAWQNRRTRFARGFEQYLEEYLELWTADLKTVQAYQDLQLVTLLTEAFDSSEWYSSIMRDLKITKDEITHSPHSVLERMPVLEKQQRKAHPDQIANRDRSLDSTGHTSGTSGSPTISYYDSESLMRSFALWRRFHHVIGIDQEKPRQVRFSGRLIVKPDASRSPFWVYNYFENQLFMSSYHMKEEFLGSYVLKLNQFKPALLDGYPSAIYVLSQYINQQNISLSFTPTAIAVTAETLYDYQRAEIESAFKCQVYNQYASSEGSPFVTECKSGKLHLNLDSGVFEFHKDDGQLAKPGEVGRLVVTSFRNLKTPLIRYDIGDTATAPNLETSCDCGCHMPVIEKLTGREDDMLWTEEKGYVGRMDTTYKGLEGIRASQILQMSQSHVVVNVVATDTFSEAMQDKLVSNLKDRLGMRVEYEVNLVEEIPLGANGKFEAVKRHFPIPTIGDQTPQQSNAK